MLKLKQIRRELGWWVMILAAIVAVEALCDIRDRLAAPVRVECECVRPLTIGSEQGETTDGD